MNTPHLCTQCTNTLPLPPSLPPSPGEPESPVLVASEGMVEGNVFSIPLIQLDRGGSPIIHYIVRYRVNKMDEDWRVKDLPSNSTVINLHDLQYKSDYHMEVLAVNSYGSSSPAKLNFNVPQPGKLL